MRKIFILIISTILFSSSITNSAILEKDYVLLTVSTPTGLREAKKIYKDKLQIVYAPWDFMPFVETLKLVRLESYFSSV